jgi:hypothetical protein
VLTAVTPEVVAFFGVDVSNFRLEATDLDFTFGEGETRRMPAQDLLLLLCGRHGS